MDLLYISTCFVLGQYYTMDPDIGMVFKKTGAEMSDAVKWQDLFIY
jgi:hypothetical protein